MTNLIFFLSRWGWLGPSAPLATPVSQIHTADATQSFVDTVTVYHRQKSPDSSQGRKRSNFTVSAHRQTNKHTDRIED